jgi:hypothetical protein
MISLGNLDIFDFTFRIVLPFKLDPWCGTPDLGSFTKRNKINPIKKLMLHLQIFILYKTKPPRENTFYNVIFGELKKVVHQGLSEYMIFLGRY